MAISDPNPCIAVRESLARNDIDELFSPDFTTEVTTFRKIAHSLGSFTTSTLKYYHSSFPLSLQSHLLVPHPDRDSLNNRKESKLSQNEDKA